MNLEVLQLSISIQGKIQADTVHHVRRHHTDGRIHSGEPVGCSRNSSSTYIRRQSDTHADHNRKLAAIRANGDMSPHAAANWMRNQMASSIRSRSPKAVSLLFGGYDVNRKTASLYSIDQLGTLNKSPFACHGYASYFCMSTLDRYHEPSQGWEKGIETLKKCISELQIRFIINLYVHFAVS